jgi:hypothetical protein
MHPFTPTQGARPVGQGAAGSSTASLVLLLTVTLGLPCVARADIVTGSYREGGNQIAYDTLSVEYAAGSPGSIRSLIFDLGGSSGASFDPAEYVFEAVGGDAVGFDLALGFDLQAPDLLRLSFTDFDPGESFAFRVDVDDPRGRTTSGGDWEGALLHVDFGPGGSAFGAYVRDPGDDRRATVLVHNPEPSSGALAGLGIAALAWWGRRRGGRRRCQHSR